MVLFDHMMVCNARDFLAHTLKGDVLASELHLPEAAHEYTVSLTIKPDYWTAHSRLGDMLALLGKWDEVITHYESIVHNAGGIYSTIGSDNLGEFMLRLGIAYCNTGQWQKGRSSVQEGKVLNPEFYLKNSTDIESGLAQCSPPH
jgi:hypothetical protein